MMRSYIFTFCICFFFNSMVMAQTWTPVADIPSGRHHPVTFALDGKGYSVTGTNSSGTRTKNFYEYDPASDAWTTLTDFPGTARSFAIGVVSNGFAYMGFGFGSNQYLDDLWRYDAQNDTWTQLASCPCSGRTHPAMIALNNKIYLGLGSDGQNLKDWWEYNISSNTWSQMLNLPGPQRHHPFQFTAGGEVYAGMGHGSGIYKDWYKLDTITKMWSIMPPFPGESRVAGTQFDHNDFGYVLSGDGDDHNFMSTGEFWQFDPATASWLELTPHPGVSRWAPGSFVIGNDVYFFGGYNKVTSTYPVSAYKYDLAPINVNTHNANHTELKVFPNPFSDELHIKTDHTENLRFRIVSIDGVILKDGIIDKGFIDTKQINRGMYILEIQDSERNQITRKWMVKMNM